MTENASNIKTQNLLWVRINYLVHETQVYLLAAPASSKTLTIFRTHLGLLNRAVLALLFPVGQFHAKKTRFEVTTSKTSYLGPNLLVRPHVVH